MAAWAAVGVNGGGLAQDMDISAGKIMVASDTQGPYFDSSTAGYGNAAATVGTGIGADDGYRQQASVLWSATEGAGVCYIGCNSGLLVTANNGASWSLRFAQAGMFAGNGAGAGDPIPSENQRRPAGRLLFDETSWLWAATYKTGIKRSPDHGATFPVVCNMGGAAPGTGNYFAQCIAQMPGTPTTLFAGFREHNTGTTGFGGVWKCANAHVTTGTPNFIRQGGLPVPHAEDMVILGTTMFVACAEGGVWMAPDITADLTSTASWVNIGTIGTFGGDLGSSGQLWMCLDAYDDGTSYQVFTACSEPQSGDGFATVWKITVSKATKAVTARVVLADGSGMVNNTTLVPDNRAWWNAGVSMSPGKAGFVNPQIRSDPANRARIYMTASQGIWRSLDSGATWRLGCTGMDMFLGRALACDEGNTVFSNPGNPGWAIAGTSDWLEVEWSDGIAANGTTTFSTTPPTGGKQGYAFAVDPVDGTVYMGHGQKYDLTTLGQVSQHARGSTTWAATGTTAWATAGGGIGPAGVCALRAGTGTGYTASDPKALLVATASNGVWRWAASGPSAGWAQVATNLCTTGTPPGYWHCFAHVAGQQHVYLFAAKDGVYHSADFGVTWTQRSALTATSKSSKHVAAHPSIMGEIWVSAQGKLYRITGAHTSSPVQTLISAVPHAGPVAIRQGDAAIVCCQNDQGSGARCLISTDHGSTWDDVAGTGDTTFGQLNFNPEAIGFGPDGRITVSGSNVAVTIIPTTTGGGGAASGTITLRQASQNIAGAAGTFAAWFSQPTPPGPSLAGSVLGVRLAMDDCTATVTPPSAGWELASDSLSGTGTGQARAQIWLYRGAPAGTAGVTSGTAATFTYTGTGTVKGKIWEWTVPAGQFAYIDRAGISSALAASIAPGPVAAPGSSRVTGGIALTMCTAVFSSAPVGQTWPLPSGWAGDGNANATTVNWHALSQTVPAGTEHVTDSISTSTGMTSWAMALVTLWAAPLQVTTTSVPSQPGGSTYSVPLAASGGAAVAPTKVGMTVPISAFGAGGFANGLTQSQADQLVMGIVSRGFAASGGHFNPPVTKKFWFAGGSQWNLALAANDMTTYKTNGTYVIICVFPKTDGVVGDPSPGVWAAANPGGTYTDASGVGGASPVRTTALADQAGLTQFLIDLRNAGWRSDQCEIVCWQEPKNNLTMNQWNVMLRTYGGIVNASNAADGHPFKLCLDMNGSTGPATATWVKAGMGAHLAGLDSTSPWATGPVSAGLPTADLLGLDYYLGSGFSVGGPNIANPDSHGDSIVSIADFLGINVAVCEAGCNPSTVRPLPANHDTIATCQSYMQYMHDFAQSRAAGGHAMRLINYWTANLNADGAGQLSSPIGLAQGGQASLPDPDFRIGPYQGWYDDLGGSGGTTGTYTWSLWDGALPPGLAITGSSITGTANAPGTYAFRVQATDSAGNIAYSQPMNVTISSAASISTTIMPVAATGEPYTAALTATGTAPFTWTMPSGTLPPGLAMSSAGVFSGTPSATGSFAFDVLVTDATGATDRTTLTITVNPPPQVTTASVPPMTIGEAASAALTADGGVPPFTWAIVSGALPSGLLLADDTITGVPDTAGAYTFAVQVTDAGGVTATQVLTISVVGAQAAPAETDSLVLAGQFELLGGGVVSDHPACPGATFYLGRDWSPGMPQPVTDLLAQLGLDGERPMGRRASNRTLTIPVVILAPDRDTLAAAREALWRAVDAQTWELTWARAGGLPLIFDCFRAAAQTFAYSVMSDVQLVTTLEITCQALPYGRSTDLESITFAAPSVSWGTTPDPISIDQFNTVTPDSQTAAWSQSGESASGHHSARWSRADRDRPHYSRTLPVPVSIGGRPKITFWLGLGTSSSRYHIWHGGRVVADITLTDASGNTIRLSETRQAVCSAQQDSPSWTRITAAIPSDTSFDTTSLTSYDIKVWNTTSNDGSRELQADAYLDDLAASAASAGAVQPRGAVYNLRGVLGTVRAPLALQLQPGPVAVQQQVERTTAGTQTWNPPAGTSSVRLEATGGGGGGGGGSTVLKAGAGGGGGGEYASAITVPVTPGTPVTMTAGAGGRGGGGGVGGANGGPGGDTIFTIGGTEVLRAHGGSGGPSGFGKGSTGGSGGTGSAAGLHFDGGDGGMPQGGNSIPRWEGSGGGGSGGAYTNGNDGQHAYRSQPGSPVFLPGSGGAAVPGGGPGGTGGNNGPGKTPGSGPGGGGGGGDGDAGADGGGGYAGRARITYGAVMGLPLQAVLVHQPGPGSPGTMGPLVRTGDGLDIPAGAIEYTVPSPVPEVPAQFRGTYTVVACAASWHGTAARAVTVTVNQYDGISGQPPVPYDPSTGTGGGVGRKSSVSVTRTLAPADITSGLAVLGDVTLPVRDLAADQELATYTVTVTSGDTADRFLDVLLLDVEGTTVMLNSARAGWNNVWLDPPDADRALGLVLGSDGDRDAASSLMADVAVTGPPLAAEPGDSWLMAYAPTGAPAMFATYSPHYWLDRLA